MQGKKAAGHHFPKRCCRNATGPEAAQKGPEPMQNDASSKSCVLLAERGSCGKWRLASNLHVMAEGERATEHSREVPPIADRDGGSSPSAPVVELRRPKSGTPSGMHRRIAVVIGLLLAVK